MMFISSGGEHGDCARFFLLSHFLHFYVLDRSGSVFGSSLFLLIVAEEYLHY